MDKKIGPEIKFDPDTQEKPGLLKGPEFSQAVESEQVVEEGGEVQSAGAEKFPKETPSLQGHPDTTPETLLTNEEVGDKKLPSDPFSKVLAEGVDTDKASALLNQILNSAQQSKK
jgi:hypothetical protein